MSKLSPKIINDPVHGFIEIPGFIRPIFEHPAFQRLRRIKQLGLSCLVYPGAVHSRFHHAIGAMHLMRMALDVLRRKGVDISDLEYRASLTAILLHDLGHGPFSHTLEFHIVRGMHHEQMSLALMHMLHDEIEDEACKEQIGLAIRIFTNQYDRRFLQQLISSQLDMDRMDYLIRDSFFTGVAEGVVGLDRIIKTLSVRDNQLLVESKGIYSVEKFVVARRLMYWQVYLHHAALVSDFMLGKILERARTLFENDQPLWLDEKLGFFFKNDIDPDNLKPGILHRFIQLDDVDIEFHLKRWQQNPDKVLSVLCQRLLNRQLLKIKLKNKTTGEKKLARLREETMEKMGIDEEAVRFFVFSGKVSNQAYLRESKEPILIRYKNGKVKDLARASDMGNIQALSKPVVKHYVCWPEL
ncbi:MAG: HD domain-containing protein [Bacteroidia bacterium]